MNKLYYDEDALANMIIAGYFVLLTTVIAVVS